MTLSLVLVTDTNIWIDLENGDILAEVFRLPYQFVIPDLAIPELISTPWPVLQVYGLEMYELNSLLMSELAQMRKTNISFNIHYHHHPSLAADYR